MTSPSERAVRDAVAGNWRPDMDRDKGFRLSAGYIKYEVPESDGWETKVKVPLAEALIDPAFWRAIGVTRGWKTGYYQRGSDDCAFEMSPWLAKQHRFIDFLAKGLSIDQALAQVLGVEETV